MMDEKGRLFGKVSVIDLLVVLAAAVIAVALYVKNDRLNVSNGTVNAAEDRTITFQLQLRGVQSYIVDAILEEDGVYDANYSSNNRPVGTITRVEITRDPGALVEARNDGTAGAVEAEGTVDALVTIEASGTLEGRQWIINGAYRLGVNSARTYYTQRVQFTGTIADIW